MIDPPAEVRFEQDQIRPGKLIPPELTDQLIAGETPPPKSVEAAQ